MVHRPIEQEPGGQVTISSEADDVDTMEEMQSVGKSATGRKRAVDALEDVMGELGRSVFEHTSLLKHATERLLAELTRRKEEEEVLLRRDAILEAAGDAAQRFLYSNAFEQTIQSMLERLTQVTGVSRVVLFERRDSATATANSTPGDGYAWWTVPANSPSPGNHVSVAAIDPENLAQPDTFHHIALLQQIPRWKTLLQHGKPVHGKASTFPTNEQAVLKAYDISSIAILPIMIDHHWWGCIWLDDCQYERSWLSAELDSLTLTTRIIGAALQRDSAQKELDRQIAFLRRVIDSNPNLIFATDHQQRFILVNQALAEFYGMTVDALIGKTVVDMSANATNIAAIHQNDLEVLTTLNEQVTPEQQITNAAGEECWLHIVKRPIFCSDGTPCLVLGVAVDITEHKHSTQALQRAYQQHRSWLRALGQRNRDITLINEMSDALQRCLTINDAYGIIVRYLTQVFVNQSGALYILYTDYNQAEAVVTWGKSPPEKLVFVPADCQALQSGRKHIVETPQETLGCMHVPVQAAPFAYICIPLIAHGETLGILHLRHSLPMTPSARERWDHLATTMTDHISLALANLYLRKRLHEQSIRDALTGLFNRRYLEETLRRELCQAIRHNRTVGVIILDIDHFKRFNDTYGHHAGDTVLQAIGMFLQANIRGGDIACRYGGEEFILILPEATLDDTYKRAEQLRHNIKHLSVNYQNQQLPVITLSLGVASFPQHGDTSEATIRSADDALYCAKARGRDCVIVAREPG